MIYVSPGMRVSPHTVYTCVLSYSYIANHVALDLGVNNYSYAYMHTKLHVGLFRIATIATIDNCTEIHVHAVCTFPFTFFESMQLFR